MNKQSVIATTSLLICTILTSWFTLRIIYTKSAPHINHPENADAFMSDITYSQLDINGLPQKTIQAERITHYPNNDATAFKKLSANVKVNGKEPWQITAGQGTSEQGMRIVHLSQNVIFYQKANTPSGKDTTITTEFATIDLNAKTAETDQPLIIKQPDTIIQAVGANADMQKGIVHLLAKVQQTHQANQNQEVTSLNADKATYDDKAHTITYIGNIKFIQGTTTSITAQKIIAYNNPKTGQTYKIVAFGQPVHYQSNPIEPSAKTDATANTIEYYPQKQLAILIGDAEIIQPNNDFKAPYITYDMNKKIIQSSTSTNNSTTIVLTP